MAHSAGVFQVDRDCKRASARNSHRRGQPRVRRRSIQRSSPFPTPTATTGCEHQPVIFRGAAYPQAPRSAARGPEAPQTVQSRSPARGGSRPITAKARPDRGERPDQEPDDVPCRLEAKRAVGMRIRSQIAPLVGRGPRPGPCGQQSRPCPYQSKAGTSKVAASTTFQGHRGRRMTEHERNQDRGRHNLDRQPGRDQGDPAEQPNCPRFPLQSRPSSSPATSRPIIRASG